MGKLREKYSSWIRNWDGVQGFNIDYSISARIGKHYCPYCSDLLQIKRIKRIVNSESEEAKNFDFSSPAGSLVGNIEFRWDVFYCANCNKELSIRDMRRYERALIRAGGNADFDAVRTYDRYPGMRIVKRLVFPIVCLATATIVIILLAISLFNS